MTTDNTNRGFDWWWKIPLIGGAYFAGTLLSGAIILGAGLEFPAFPGQKYSPALSFVASLVLAATVYLLARGLQGSRSFRGVVLFAFTYVSYCVNNQIEGATFTTAGGQGTMLLFFVLPCALIAGVAALLVKPPAGARRLTTVFADRPLASWWWRAALAWLAFPVIYYFFGMFAYPFVRDAYEGGELPLRVPTLGVLIAVVSLRSLIFLLVTVPILMHWSGSRRGLIVAVAAAFSAMVGVAGLIEATFLPSTMRLVHSVEIIADSIVHAWVLVALLVSRNKRSAEELSPAAAR